MADAVCWQKEKKKKEIRPLDVFVQILSFLLSDGSLEMKQCVRVMFHMASITRATVSDGVWRDERDEAFAYTCLDAASGWVHGTVGEE